MITTPPSILARPRFATAATTTAMAKSTTTTSTIWRSRRPGITTETATVGVSRATSWFSVPRLVVTSNDMGIVTTSIPIGILAKRKFAMTISTMIALTGWTTSSPWTRSIIGKISMMTALVTPARRSALVTPSLVMRKTTRIVTTPTPRLIRPPSGIEIPTTTPLEIRRASSSRATGL